MTLPEWISGFIIVVLLVGFPITLIMAWAFEITPEGIKKDSDISPEQSITAHTGRKLDFIIIGLLVAALGYFTWNSQLDNTIPEISSSPQTQDVLDRIPTNIEDTVKSNTIAVLPFADLSQAGDQEYFSDGIAEEILNVLVRINSFKVSSRTSAFQFKGSNKGIPEIAKQLKVRYVLEGSVRKSGETIRITAQLIDAQDDKHLWSENYDRPLSAKNIFAIQDEISNAIVQAMSDELGLAGIKQIKVNAVTNNFTAYELYLRAVPLFFGRIDLDLADNYLVTALELDPKYAKAWELRAALQALKEDYGYTDKGIEEVHFLTKKFALKAIELNSQSALAMAALANIQHNATDLAIGNVDFHEMFALYDKAIEIDPNSVTSHAWRGWSYLAIGKLELSQKDFQRCLELEPLYSMCYTNWLTTIGQQKSYEIFSPLLKAGLNKDIINIRYLDLSVLARNHQELLFKVVVTQKGNLVGFRKGEQFYNAYLNPQNNHRELIDEIKTFADKNQFTTDTDLSRLLIPIGAFELFPDPTMIWGVEYKTYRESSKFKDYIINSGINKYWMEKGYPTHCRAIGDDDFECD
ncbi:MAG: TolB-like protein [Enterobacterales bacterium]|jgi:TolB-like protein